MLGALWHDASAAAELDGRVQVLEGEARPLPFPFWRQTHEYMFRRDIYRKQSQRTHPIHLTPVLQRAKHTGMNHVLAVQVPERLQHCSGHHLDLESGQPFAY